MGWPQNAYVGQKVVCVDASPKRPRFKLRRSMAVS